MSAIRSALDGLFADTDDDQSPSELASELTTQEPLGTPIPSGLYVFGIRRGSKRNLSPTSDTFGGMGRER